MPESGSKVRQSTVALPHHLSNIDLPPPPSSSSPKLPFFFCRCDNNNGRRIDGQPVTVPVTEPSGSASLIVALTGFHLLNIASIVIFGIWKVLLAGDGRLVVVTKVELGLLMLSSVMYAFFLVAFTVGGPGPPATVVFVGLTGFLSQIVLPHESRRKLSGDMPEFLPS
jgi:hypothetical protein